MEFKIEAVARQIKTTKASNKTYTGMKLEGVGWVNVMGNMLKFIPQDTIHLTQPKTIGDGDQLWAFPKGSGKNEAESVPRETAYVDPLEPEIPPPTRLPTPTATEIHEKDKTAGAWASFVRFAWGVAKDLEPNDPQARVALVNTAVIAWTHGGIEWSAECDGGCCCATQEEVPF